MTMQSKSITAVECSTSGSGLAVFALLLLALLLVVLGVIAEPSFDPSEVPLVGP
jgi:hypothetical protein